MSFVPQRSGVKIVNKPVSRPNVHESANMKALRDLKQGMDRNAKFGKMVTYSVECMGRMAVDQVSVEEIITSGCIESSLSACKISPNNSNVQTSVNKALLRCCIDDHCIVEVSKAINGDFTPFLNSLTNHTNDREALLSTAQVLSKLGNAPPPEGPRNIAEMKRLGITDALADQLAAVDDGDSELITALAEALSPACEDVDVIQMVIDKGVMDKLVKCLANNPTDKNLAGAIAKLIANACSSGDEHIIAQLKKMGTLTALAATLQAHPHNKDLIATIGAAVSYLSDMNDVENVIAVLKTSENQSWDQISNNMSRLVALTLVPSHLPYFKNVENIKPLVEVMNKAVAGGMQPIMVGAVGQVNIAISNINKGGEHNIYGIMCAGGVNSLTQVLHALLSGALDASSAAEQTQYVEAIVAGMAALRGMLTRNENIAYLESNHAILAAIEAARPFMHDPVVARTLCDLVSAALQFPENVNASTIAKMIDTMLQVLTLHLDDPEVAALALDALNRLALTETEEQIMLDNGILPHIMYCLKKHVNDKNVSRAALIALDMALMVPDGRSAVEEDATRTLLNKLKKNFSDDDEFFELFDNIEEGLLAEPILPLAQEVDISYVPIPEEPVLEALEDITPVTDENLDLLNLLAKLKNLGNTADAPATVNLAAQAEPEPEDNIKLDLVTIAETPLEPVPNPIALVIMESFNKIQLLLTERRAAKLLSMFEILCEQPRSYDRDYILNALLDAISAIAEESAEAEALFFQNEGRVTPDVAALLLPNNTGVSLVLRDLENGIITHSLGERVCDTILASSDDEDLAVLSDNFATLISFVDRDSLRLVCARCGLLPQPYANVGTEEVPYESSNPDLDNVNRMMAIEEARQALEEMRLQLDQAEILQNLALKQQRELEIARVRNMTEIRISAENQAVLDRIAAAKAEAEEKSRQIRADMARKLAEAKAEQQRKLDEMNRLAEEKRQQQIAELREAARAATLAKIELEKRIADGGVGLTSGNDMKVLNNDLAQFLVVGGLLIRHTKNGVQSRHLYLTPNFQYLVWRNAGDSDVRPKDMMKLEKFAGFKIGRYSDIFRANKKIQDADETRFFVIQGADCENQDRELSFEIPESSGKIGKMWAQALNHLLEYASSLNKFHGENTAMMQTNPLQRILQYEGQLNELQNNPSYTTSAERKQQSNVNFHGGFQEDADDY